MPAITEAMIRVVVDKWVIRCWIAVEPEGIMDISSFRDILEKKVTLIARNAIVYKNDFDGYSIAKQIATEIKHCNACEVIDIKGNGFVHYPEWP